MNKEEVDQLLGVSYEAPGVRTSLALRRAVAEILRLRKERGLDDD